MMEKIELEADTLLLDHSNPRIGTVASQAEALKAIVDLDPRHFKTMMESIRDHGLDPGDSFYVIDEEASEEYVVVDGNRRLAALKVLIEPNLLQGAGIEDPVRSRLAKVAADFDVKTLTPVSCVVFDSRGDADEWILRRHGRGMEGEARIHWGSLEIQRFQRDQTVLDVIEFVARNSSYSDEKWSQIKGAIEKKPSVVKRFLDSGPVRKLLGISVADEGGERIPSFQANPETALAVLSQIFEDIAANEIDTRTHNKTQDIADYISEIPAATTSGHRTKSSARFRDSKITGGVRPRQTQPLALKPAVKRSTAKPPRSFLAPKRHLFAQPSDSKGQRLVLEASKLKLKEMPLSCAFVLRAFIEHTLNTYMQKHNLTVVDKKGTTLDLKHKAETVIDHLTAAKAANAQDLRGAKRTMTVTTDPSSIQALNDYHHNRFHVPTGDALRSAWDSCEALFLAVYGTPQ